MNKQKIICAFKDVKLLYAAYMPFLKNGGLFVRTDQDIAYGSMVDLEVTFFDEKIQQTFEGKVIWKTFADSSGAFPVGIGIQFEGERARQINDLVRKHLASFTDVETETDTI